MDCFLHQRKNSVDDEYFSKIQLQHQQICCQAYVQVLFEDKERWVPEMTGELIVYVVKCNFDNNEQMYLSFFSGPRQRFQIKVSEIEKLYKSHPNLIVVIHGKTILGFNFAIEHVNRVDIFMQTLKPKLPSMILAAKIKRAAENVSTEVKKAATRMQHTFNLETFKKHQIPKTANQKPECTKQASQRRLSDPSIDTTLDSFGANKKSFLNSSLLLPLKNQNNVKSKPEFASDATIESKPQNFKRSQSLRFHQNQENAEYENVADTTTNVKNLIDLWNSKTKHK